MCHPVAVHAPDRVLEKGEFFGHEYLITHNTMGFRCAYVKVEPGHPWHGVHYNDEPVCSILAHWGITAADADVPCDGEGSDSGWWLGVDFVHSEDLPDYSLPMRDKSFADTITRIYGRAGGGKLWTQDLVRDHIQMIAAQAAAAKGMLKSEVHAGLPA